MDLTITTNNVPRDLLSCFDLTDKERAEFDYIEDMGDAIDRFFRYRGNVYDSHEFVRIELASKRTNPYCLGVWEEDSPLLNWDGYQSDSMFSGIVVRYCEDYERVIVGLAMS